MTLHDTYIIDGIRTPIGRYGGALSGIRADDLGAIPLKALLARHAGQPVSKETLSQEALGRPLTRFDRSIDVHISGIRQKLGQLPDGSSPIETVIRQGYMLVLP